MQARQQGMILIEALVGILIFSMGILALIAMQTAAISAQSDAQYRIEAANLVNKMLSEMWLNVDRTSGATIQTSLAAFEHQPTTDSNCSFSGSASANAIVTSWVSDATTAGTGLPGSTSAMQQILVDTGAGAYNKVTITLCWKAPNDTAAHKQVVVSNIN